VFVLDGFGVVERRLAKGGVRATFDTDDPGDAVGGSELDLIGGQRRASGIQLDVHRAEASAAFLKSRLLRQKPRRQHRVSKASASPLLMAATSSTSLRATSMSRSALNRGFGPRLRAMLRGFAPVVQVIKRAPGGEGSLGGGNWVAVLAFLMLTWGIGSARLGR